MNNITTKNTTIRHTLRAALVVTALANAGCVPLLIGGAAVGGATVVTDRRPVGIQLEDEAIENRINRGITQRFERNTVNVNVTSYNRKVVLAGQVPTEEAKAQIEKIAQRAENVREVMNELEVGFLSTITSRTNDTAIAAKVRAALLEARDVKYGALALTVENGTVFLLGRVTEAEGAAAARVAARVSGVQRVVKAFDYMSEAALAEREGRKQ